ncbi:Uu.00g108160.m01.CDS01 [Anthostomella pinea]|uniref:Uu.00g108160.m01.CDS01 n=1 Tax=Anthostomella pinea TaxID=933095 RepID=A0AAI8VEF1_9PEZI|nr:Uu.00g108160.m01.CDS01 [Anthostomella pinea]
MQLTNVFISFVLATAVSAKGHNNGTTSVKSASVKSQCHEVAKLTSDVELATNDTQLGDHFDNNQTEIAAFKAKAADMQTELDTMSSNSTLMTSCAVIAAHEDAVDSCDKMQSWEKSIAAAANGTKLTDKFDGNATKVTAFQAKASSEATKLAALASNSTLTQFCSVQSTLSDCKTMSKLQKEMAFVNNATALSAKLDGNQTKIDKATAKVAKLQSKLDALISNSTLMSTCSSLTQASADGTTTADNAASSTTAASAAGRVEAAGGMIAAAVLAMTAALFMM